MFVNPSVQTMDATAPDESVLVECLDEHGKPIPIMFTTYTALADFMEQMADSISMALLVKEIDADEQSKPSTFGNKPTVH